MVKKYLTDIYFSHKSIRNMKMLDLSSRKRNRLCLRVAFFPCLILVRAPVGYVYLFEDSVDSSLLRASISVVKIILSVKYIYYYKLLYIIFLTLS